MKEHVTVSTSDHDQEAGQRSVNVFCVLQDKDGNEEEEVDCREIKSSETKLKGNKVQELMDKKFANWEFYNSLIVEGRLLIIWRKSFVRVLVIVESAQHVHCVVKMAGQVNAFCLTFVYGFNDIEDRKILWKNLVQLNFPVSPWLILGDFNSVFYVDDRNGGNPISHTEMVDSNLWLAQSNVVALKRFGSTFTWTNNQVGSSRIYSKIDHAFVNEEWHDFFPNTAARFSWEAISDHFSCADHHDFKTIVEQSWKRPVTSRGLKGIYIKLMRVKHCLKKFNHEVIGDIGKRFQDVKSSYSEAKFQAQAHPRDKTYQDIEAIAAAKFDLQEKMYHKFLSQRSKITWLQKGDSNTSYFHACLKKRIMENKITSFMTEQGLINDKFSDVVEHFLNHFRSYMGSNSSKAMFSIPDTKSPGPDGFGSGFFKSMWPVIGGEVCAAVANFFETVYKCISKLLCSRLATVLPSLVHQNQGAFFQGRSIAHNVMILQDILKNYRRKNTSPRCTIKIDISKLVMICIKSTSYSLLINGRKQGGFQGAKGLRQDDLILLSKGSKQSIKVLKEVLDGFSTSTGLFINVSKSQIFFGGVDAREKREIIKDIGLAEGCFPLKYLGVPLRPTKWKAEDCGIIIKKIRLRLNTWGSRHLSFAGRVQLIHSVLLGLRNYWMSIFILPQSVSKEVEKLCRGFL
ncbi:uncharacterized protein LOC133779074 [Humulus lupulus]|uniref:uncharacterized protein LOC133779074 n=1 Tax=Humulus lupulus TaxID=3486 RepID=UPI002B4139C9|nr:uncharacterized protein LOC133779074 [Humulus lupulus]